MISAMALFFFPILMAYSAFSDMFTMTISNRISILLVVGFVVLAFVSDMPLTEIGWNLTCGLAVLAITFALFAFGYIGGGDAKLAAATAVWIGWDHIGGYGIVAALAGAVLTLVIVYIRFLPMPEWLTSRAWFARLYDKASGIPYGIALAIAGLVVYPHTRIWVEAFI